jgi:hypothetical protein
MKRKAQVAGGLLFVALAIAVIIISYCGVFGLGGALDSPAAPRHSSIYGDELHKQTMSAGAAAIGWIMLMASIGLTASMWSKAK